MALRAVFRNYGRVNPHNSPVQSGIYIMCNALMDKKDTLTLRKSNKISQEVCSKASNISHIS